MIVRIGIKTKEERTDQGDNKSCPLKESLDYCQIKNEGCYDFINDRFDYNHFRTSNRKLIDKNSRSVSIMFTYQYDILNNINLSNNFTNDIKLSYGSLGENITIDLKENIQLIEKTKIKIGKVELQFEDKMKPCHRLSYYNNLFGKNWWRKDNDIDISKYINSNDHRGWYCRVIKEGFIYCKDKFEII